MLGFLDGIAKNAFSFWCYHLLLQCKIKTEMMTNEKAFFGNTIKKIQRRIIIQQYYVIHSML